MFNVSDQTDYEHGYIDHLIARARCIPSDVSDNEAVEKLVASGIERGVAFLAVKAARVMNNE